MKAYLRSARIAPKKANLVARMVRGMPVPAALDALAHTNKKAARLIETLLQSAMANASFNAKQDPQQMVIASIVVNQGMAYRRGMPKARGQTRPYRKFLSHIEIILAYPDVEGVSEGKNQKKQKSQKSDKTGESASQDAKKPVKQLRSAKEKEKKNIKSSVSSASSVSSVS